MNDIRHEILQAMLELSAVYPEMRFGQLVVNISNWSAQIPDGLWDLEDDQFLIAAREHLAKCGISSAEQSVPSGQDQRAMQAP